MLDYWLIVASYPNVGRHLHRQLEYCIVRYVTTVQLYVRYVRYFFARYITHTLVTVAEN